MIHISGVNTIYGKTFEGETFAVTVHWKNFAVAASFNNECFVVKHSQLGENHKSLPP